MNVNLWETPYGDDLMVVNAARVSFGKRSETFSESDANLIRFLARGMTTEDFEKFIYQVDDASDLIWIKGEKEHLIDHLWQWRRTPTHFAPFAHPQASFHIKAPIFVARQLAKHQVGMVWSEVSRRYVDSEPEFYQPEVWRKRADNVKQGSSDDACNGQLNKNTRYNDLCEQASEQYRLFVAEGMCHEQARMVLPQSMMTEWIWTGSLYAWANVYNQRTNSHAQRETQEVAKQIGQHMAEHFPVSWEALTGVVK